MIDCAMRRRDLLLSLSSAALWAPHAFGQSVATPALRLQLDSDRVIGTIPDGFTGLSYESAVLSDPSFFTGDNTDLVAFFRRLGGAGVLRLGGNTSEYGVWTPQRPGTAPDVAPALGPDTGRKRK